MKHTKSILGALAVGLTLLASPAWAADVPVNVPDTAKAVQAGDLIARAKRALADKLGAGVANVWIFPTNDANTVFVQYSIATTSAVCTIALPAEHLAVVVMNGDRIEKLRELVHTDTITALRVRN